MTKLSVNVNKVALIRNSRGRNFPSLEKVVLDMVRFGADGITLHPRPDERHAKKSDVRTLKNLLAFLSPPIELNVEGYPSADFLDLINETLPAQATLVPDPPEALTSNAGWVVSQSREILERTLSQLNPSVRTSVFVDPNSCSESDLKALKSLGCHRIELYTERYADCFGKPSMPHVLAEYKKVAAWAKTAGLGVNAGHDLNLENLKALIEAIPWIDEVSIGHALTVESLYLGFEQTLKRYQAILKTN